MSLGQIQQDNMFINLAQQMVLSSHIKGLYTHLDQLVCTLALAQAI